MESAASPKAGETAVAWQASGGEVRELAAGSGGASAPPVGVERAAPSVRLERGVAAVGARCGGDEGSLGEDLFFFLTCLGEDLLDTLSADERGWAIVCSR